jgi:hypothetical protein
MLSAYGVIVYHRFFVHAAFLGTADQSLVQRLYHFCQHRPKCACSVRLVPQPPALSMERKSSSLLDIWLDQQQAPTPCCLPAAVGFGQLHRPKPVCGNVFLRCLGWHGRDACQRLDKPPIQLRGSVVWPRNTYSAGPCTEPQWLHMGPAQLLRFRRICGHGSHT